MRKHVMRFMINAMIVFVSMVVFSCTTRDEDGVKTYSIDENKTSVPSQTQKIADHSVVDILRFGRIPESAILNARDKLHIGYGHTSHGSQITFGMTGLVEFANNGGLGFEYSRDLFAWNKGGLDGALDIRTGAQYSEGYLRLDCGYEGWADETRKFLNDPLHSDVNVIMWSWCGQVTHLNEHSLISHYLTPMEKLEKEYPNVQFVYMTGHLNSAGTGPAENTHLRNEQIREFCRVNGKWLFDFADIESYNPDGVFFGNRMANDECAYDSNGDGIIDANWATEWQNNPANTGKWFTCKSPHSQPVVANLKAYAIWWLWARMAGWDGLYSTTQ